MIQNRKSSKLHTVKFSRLQIVINRFTDITGIRDSVRICRRKVIFKHDSTKISSTPSGYEQFDWQNVLKRVILENGWILGTKINGLCNPERCSQ